MAVKNVRHAGHDQISTSVAPAELELPLTRTRIWSPETFWCLAFKFAQCFRTSTWCPCTIAGELRAHHECRQVL
jgi:hypothetical protein